MAVVSLGVVVALVLIARPTHELPPLPTVVAVLPSAAVDEPAGESAALTEPTSAVAAARTGAIARIARPLRLAGRPALSASTRAAWSPSALPRVSVPVSWRTTASRAGLSRDNPQSP